MVEIEMCGFNFFWIIIMIQASAVLGSFEILIKVGSCTLLLTTLLLYYIDFTHI